MSCIFCRIASGEVATTKAYEDSEVVAFYDTAPQAPTHILVIPKAHIPSLSAITEENAHIGTAIFRAIAELSKRAEFAGGFRVVSNSGADGGQTVGHLHFHMLGGRALGWPPG
jgi:histidine triad (HIT) family protein